MAGYCTSVRPYFHEPQASENIAQELIRCFSSSYECIPIRAHAAVARQHMPCRL